MLVDNQRATNSSRPFWEPISQMLDEKTRDLYFLLLHDYAPIERLLPYEVSSLGTVGDSDDARHSSQLKLYLPPN